MRRSVSLVITGLVIMSFLVGCAQETSTVAPTKPSVPAVATTTTPPSGATSAPAAAAAPATTAAAPAAKIKRGGTLKVSVSVDPQTLDAHVSTRRSAGYVMRALHNGLIKFDENLKLIPDLAESWDAPDSTTFIFKIKPGVKFHDGSDLDADAVKANFTRIMDPNTKAVNLPDFEPIKDVQVVDKSTLKLSLKAPMAPLLALLAEQAALMVSPSAIQKFGKDLARNPVGTGPFQLAEWKDGDHLTVKRFDNYWEKGLPYLDQILFTIAPDDAVRLINLRSGNSDVMMDVPFKDVSSLQSTPDWKYWSVLGGYYEMRINGMRPPFDNKSLRQAVNYALDREALVKVLLSGQGQPGVGPTAPSLWSFNPNQKGYTRDVAKAKQKLAEGGQPNGFKFTMDVPSQSTFQRMAELAKFQLAEASIEAELNVLEQVAATQRETAAQFTANLGNIAPRSDSDTVLYAFFHSKGGKNIANYANAKVDPLLERARSTTKVDERKQLYSEAEALIIEDAPRAWLVYFPTSAVSSRSVQGFMFAGDGVMHLTTTWLDK